MKFGKKTEPEKCSRCFRTKNEAISEQKDLGEICSDPNCTYKDAIYKAIHGNDKAVFKHYYCPFCGAQYYKPYSSFCHHCGEKRQ